MPNDIKPFTSEQLFEDALVAQLLRHGWKEILHYPTEEELVQNWANIIYDMNRSIDCLGNYPLTKSEMRQVIDRVNMCDSPFAVNKLITGKQVCIKRDNFEDTHNYGKEVYLKIFDPMEISAGQSRYQIARQPQFKTSDPMIGKRRGDFMLLINGMPVIHVELKRSKVDVSLACGQLKRYFHEGVFAQGIFSMVQIFVAMNPEDTIYFANPGAEDKFQPNFYFHWADFNNVRVNNWQIIASDFLSIPMAHQMIGFYTIADDKDKTLKVLRSYQYHAVSKISDAVRKTNWDDHHHHGGYVWHTTGSGKTMTSFKSADLISKSGDADKVVFLLDRIELAVQSLDEYRGFAGESDSINDTADTSVLVSKLKSSDPDDCLIVTSIQKMSNVKECPSIPGDVIRKIGQKRLVFIIDECHRSVFGDMLIDIKRTFPRALLFGFTGTPVFEENAKKEVTTETIFGDMLHKYTIASAIPDGNVLGFDPYMVNTYDEGELRELVAFRQIDLKLKECNPEEELMKRTVEEYMELIDKDVALYDIYDKFMNQLQMPDSYYENGKKTRGIEHYLPKDIYRSDKHHIEVVEDIVASRQRLSKNGKFHAILATKSIPEAIEYYKLFKKRHSSMNVVAIFDNNIDNTDGGIAREDALIEMLKDYNGKFHTAFGLPNYAQYKKDVAKRLAHKKPYLGIENDHDQQIDLLIVVTQMLTGYDSKWVNTLYVDKLMEYVNVIQAFSRTNRIFGPEKPFGIIKYYSYPYTMQQNIDDALEVYVDRPLGVFVDKLETNLCNINQRFLKIRDIFHSHQIMNFEKLPDTREDRNMFAKCFSEMTHLLEAAKLQGFVWEQNKYEFNHGSTYTNVVMEIDEQTYIILLQRYRELFEPTGPIDPVDPWEYAIDTFITETGTGTIDADYINSKFQKFIKNLYAEGLGSELTKSAKEALCNTFASLSQNDQRTALIILHDIQSGDLLLDEGKTIQDYINKYQVRELEKQVENFSAATGINKSQLMNIITSDVTEENLNEYNRFEDLKATSDLNKCRDFIFKITGSACKTTAMITPKMDNFLRQFIFDPLARERILYALFHDGATISSGMPEQQETFEETQEADVLFDVDKVKTSVKTILDEKLAGVARYMRPQNDVLDSVFFVMQAPSIESLDGVGPLLERAFANLFVKKATIVDKHVALTLLVSKFEAYLKKLHYLVEGTEIQPQFEGKDVTWKEVVHAIRPLWNLKYNEDEAYQQLYNDLLTVKEWRNNEAHISPTATMAELDDAIKTVISLYFYATGSMVTELECNGHDVTSRINAVTVNVPGSVPVKEENNGLMFAAENND